MKNQKNITDRKQLKTFFKKGSLPGETAFEKLIDSTFNKADDKLDITDDGLMLYPSDNEKLLSFFEDKDDPEARWALFISKKENGGLFIRRIEAPDFDDNTPDEEKIPPPAFHIQKGTENIGLGTASPAQKLDVQGYVASKGRVGTFLEDQVNADGNWHNIFNKPLYGSYAFEITAYAQGNKYEGKYSLLHAIAISTYGNSKPKISKTVAHYGKWWNKIDIRWESRPSFIAEDAARKKVKGLKGIGTWLKGIREYWDRDPQEYNLQIRTKSNYGENKKVYFKVSVLWDQELSEKVTKE